MNSGWMALAIGVLLGASLVVLWRHRAADLARAAEEELDEDDEERP